MKQLTKKFIDNGGLIIGVTLFANILNFFFNAYLGRALSFENYGLVTVLNTCWYLISIPMDSLMNTVNRETAYLVGKKEQGKSLGFFKQTGKKSMKTAFLAGIVWAALSVFIANFFHISSVIPVLLFAPIIPLGVYSSLAKGYLMGNLIFMPLAIVLVIESLSKLISAIGLVTFHLDELAYLSMPLSVVVAFGFALVLIGHTIKNKKPQGGVAFPKGYYLATVITALSMIAFLTFDLILAKHFLPPREAGQYALLSLIGKIIYFFGGLPNTFMITFVARALGADTSPHRSFYIFLTCTFIIAFGCFVGLGLLGSFIVPVLFGAKALEITGYLIPYTLALSIFTIASSITIFHLARRQYIFPLVSISMSVFMAALIVAFHNDISQIVANVLIAGSVCFLTVLGLHIAEKIGKFNANINFLPLSYLKKT